MLAMCGFFVIFFSILACIVLTFRVVYFVRVCMCMCVCVCVRLYLSILFIYFFKYYWYFLCVYPAKYLGVFSLLCATY